MSPNPRPPKEQVVGLLGVGLDGTDGHKRITRNEDVLLVGGSEATHACLQAISIKFNESLQQRGKRLRDAEATEIVELLHKAADQ